MRQKIRIYRISVIALAAIGAVGLSGCGRGGKENPAVKPIAIRIARPSISDMQSRLSYIGTVRSSREVQVIAQVQGTVISIPFLEGELVGPGDVVARIDAPDLNATVERLRADADYWQRRHESDKRLVSDGALPEEQWESSRRAYNSARAALKEAEARLAKTVEKAPVDGKVLHWSVQPGQTVMPGQPILMLGDDDLEIHVEVIEEDLRRGIDVGVEAEIDDGWGRRLAAQVSEVAPKATGRTRSFLAKLPMKGDDDIRIRTGASVRVYFILDAREGVLTVPVNAVADRDNDPHVFVIRDDRAFRQDVVLGIEQGGWIEASFPWDGETFVAVSNLVSLEDSMPVFTVLEQEVLK